MLTDVASDCKESKADTAASATLCVALAWAHIGEAKRAREVHAQAAALDCQDATFQSVLAESAAALGVA
jgi:hypothetical protein